jgi:hypothetical protein
MASRAHGDRIDRTGGRVGFLLRLDRAGAFRDDRRRGGEVFVATYTSITTGRMTGLRWVTS